MKDVLKIKLVVNGSTFIVDRVIGSHEDYQELFVTLDNILSQELFYKLDDYKYQNMLIDQELEIDSFGDYSKEVFIYEEDDHQMAFKFSGGENHEH